MILGRRIKEVFSRLFGVKTKEFEKLLQEARPLWQSEVIDEYKAPGGCLFKRDLAEMILILLLHYRHYVT